jgi:hypothetical protein|tara:strand:+ start:498 stop:2621 length:2124 start_codon:yes stop_codon:yes gene_type:complete
MAYYYPEGPFGPICDLPPTDTEIEQRSRPAIPDSEREGDVELITQEDLGSIYEPLIPVLGEAPAFFIRRRCKERTLADGTIERYDCEYDFDGDTGENYDDGWDGPKEGLQIGINDNFFVPNTGPESCSPFKPDINIRPLTFFGPNGVKFTRTAFEGSSPVTYPVESASVSSENQPTITAQFSEDRQNLVIGGTGTGIVNLSLTWKDDPGISGLAVNQLTVGGKTWTQNGKRGSQTEFLTLTPGTYPIVLSGQSGTSGSRLVGTNRIEYDDDFGNGFDLNATFLIESVLAETPYTVTDGYWSDEGNTYGVWVNPAQCTLPLLPQQVTYKIEITEAGEYGFTFGCDDNATLTIGTETSPFLTAQGGIFKGGSYNTPYTATRTLAAGTLLLTVNCTNSAAGFLDANGDPIGKAFDWTRNPGGWYIKMCKGGVCAGGNNITWVTSGPHPKWSDFMNTYAVWPNNTDPLLDAAQTATWNINIPTTGNYVFECSADNTATFSLDGTQIASSSSFTSTTSVNLTNVSDGAHTISVTCTNQSSSNGANTWTDNPGGAAWRIKYAGGQIAATFDSQGRLIVTGAGAATLDFDFEWDDNPNSYGTALGTYSIPDLGVNFTQTSGVTSGSDSHQKTNVTAGTYAATILNANSAGFTRKQSNTRLCFQDGDDDDCNAQVDVTVTQTDAIIASSLDLNTPGDGNIFWHTRKAVGYTYIDE